jgi:hypothetical protein
MGRPWTVVATEKQTGNRVSFVFNSEFDMKHAASDFVLKFEQLSLEAMIPGDHKEVYIQTSVTKHNKDAGRKIPKHQMFSGF